VMVSGIRFMGLISGLRASVAIQLILDYCCDKGSDHGLRLMEGEWLR
jgi:hypothetical protein